MDNNGRPLKNDPNVNNNNAKQMRQTVEDTGCLYHHGDAMGTDWQLLGMDSKPVDHNYCGSGPHMCGVCV